MMRLEIGSYCIEHDPTLTAREYAALPAVSQENVGALFFHHLMKKAPREARDFLTSLGIGVEKISLCRPLTEPDEAGEILYFASAPLCAVVLAGGQSRPRQSEEIAGISVVFVGEEQDFTPALPRFAAPMAELRFVIPLPFDPSFFGTYP